MLRQERVKSITAVNRANDQLQMAQKLRELENKDYSAHPTKATASVPITLTLESHWDKLFSIDDYAGYAVHTLLRAHRIISP